jgi:hypothetical protein
MPPVTRSFPWWTGALLVLGSCGLAAAWIAIAMLTGCQCAWMALFAALDAAWLLRLAGAPPGNGRMLAGIGATAVAIALANWGIAAAQLSGPMGLDFLDSATRLGSSLAWTLSTLANGGAGLAWLLAGLLLAAIAAR